MRPVNYRPVNRATQYNENHIKNIDARTKMLSGLFSDITKLQRLYTADGVRYASPKVCVCQSTVQFFSDKLPITIYGSDECTEWDRDGDGAYDFTGKAIPNCRCY